MAELENEFNIWQQESMHQKILRQFNTPKRDGGFNANGYEEYPRMLYKARKHPLGGKYYVFLEEDELSADRTRVIVDAQSFNRSCQMEVPNAEMEERATKNGWRRTLGEAMEAHEAEVLALATSAAHRNYEDRAMSEKAQAEALRVDQATEDQVAEVPRASVRRGRPKGSKNKPKVTEPAA